MNPIEIIFRGKDEVRPAADSVKADLAGVQDAATKTSSAFDTAMGVLAAQQVQMFANAMGDFMKSSIDEATDASKIMAQLDAVIASTGGSAGLSADQISDMATQMSRLTGIDDEAIIAGQTILLQFTSLGKDVFPQATQAMVDLATRMGIDIPSAAKIVGKALEGEYSGLTRFGIVLDDQTQKKINGLLEQGKIAEAQAIIIEELNKRFGGSAEAAANTAAGAFQKVQTAWDNAKQSFGEALTKNESFQITLTHLADAINAVADAFMKLPPGVQTGIAGFAGLLTLLAQAAPALISAKVLLGGLGGTAAKAGTDAARSAGLWTRLVNVIKAFVASSAGIITIGTVLTALLETGITKGAAAAGKALQDFLGVQLPQELTAARDALLEHGPFSPATWQAMYTTVKYGLETIDRMFQAFRTTMITLGTNIVAGIRQGISAAWEGLKAWFQGLLDGLLSDAQDTIEAQSPSRVWADKIGKPMALGIGQGFASGMAQVTPGMGALLQPAPAYARAGAVGNGGTVTFPGATFQFYSSLTHEERRRIRREEEDVALKQFGRLLK